MKIRVVLFALVTSFLCAVGCQKQVALDTDGVRDSTQLVEKLKSAQANSIDYGEEQFRQVSGPDEIVSTLRNGLVVIVKRVPSNVCAVRAYALTGGVYEGRWLGGGLSHLLEHLCAGCTNTRRTEEQNRNLLQAIGNNSNAYTDYDHTAFFINTTTPHLDEAVDLVTSWMFTCSIALPEFNREHEIVQRELERDKGQPDDVFAELSFDNRYRVSPARVPVIGYQEVIQGLSRDDVYSYYKQAYQPNNMVFAIAGDLPPEQMLKSVQKWVRDVMPGRAFSHEVAQEPPLAGPRTIVATFPKLGDAKLELAFPTVKLTDPDVYALDLLAMALGGSDSSILVEELRDKKQLAEAITATDFTPTYAEGSFTIDMAVDPETIQEVTDDTLDAIEQIKATGLDAKRLARAKTQMRVMQIKSRQTSEALIAQMAIDYFSTGDPHFTDRYLERIAKLTSADLQRVAKKYLDRSKLLTTALVSTDAAGSSELPAAENVLRQAAPTTKPTTAPAEPSRLARVELGNGNVLLHRRISASPFVSIQLYALGGLTAEEAKTNGLGNLAMEMLSRGTKSKSAEDISEALDDLGAELDANCGTNTWSWSGNCLRGDLPKLADLMNDFVANPAFDDDEFDATRDRLLAGIDAEDADWSAQATRFFESKYFGPMHSPYAFEPAGTTENLKRFTAKQTQNWYEEKVLKSPRVIAIFGDVSLDDAKKCAQTILQSLPAAPSANPLAASQAEPARASKPSVDVTRFEIQKTDQPLAGVFIGFKSDSTMSDPQRFAMTVANCMCSGYEGPTGYLFDDLRGRGLVYEVEADNMPGLNAKLPGAFVAQAGCDPTKVNEVVDLMLLNIARLQGSAKDMQADWFERSKLLITTQAALDQETAEAQGAQASLAELFGLGYDDHAHFAERINAVTMEQVRDVAHTRLHDCVITISTPRPELVNRKTGARAYDSFPPVDLTPRGVQHDVGGGATSIGGSGNAPTTAPINAPIKK